MQHTITSAESIRNSLKALGHAGLKDLARLSGVPFTTLWKISDGTTKNPGIETVRQFMPHIQAVAATKAAQAEPLPEPTAAAQ